MISVVNTKDILNCVGDPFIKEITLDSPITKEIIFKLGEGGELEYLDRLKKPFFKISYSENYLIKGVEGNNSLRVILKDPELKNGDLVIKKGFNYLLSVLEYI